jgi:hypothetical protein
MNEFWKRMIIPLYNSKKVIKSVKKHGLVKGITEDTKELAKEAPIISSVYNIGKSDGVYEGKKKGYVQASNKYEKKLLEQAEKFKEQKVVLENDIEERDSLLKEYEVYIEEKEAELEKLTKKQLQTLFKIKKQYEELLPRV